jgi:quercetin dioxygenase-like cupin family protein
LSRLFAHIFSLDEAAVLRKGIQAMTKAAGFGEEARALAGLIEYQEGTVVSRPLLGKATGTVTLFAFDADQGLSEHSTPHDALVYLVEGDLEVTIAGEAHRLAGGDLLHLPADEPHALQAFEPSKMMLIMIRADRPGS